MKRSPFTGRETASASAKHRELDDAFGRLARMTWQEVPEYYARYRSRYEAVLDAYQRTGARASDQILEIGGGQLAVLARWLWGNSATVADIGPLCFPNLNHEGVETFVWNVARDDSPVETDYDVVFMSEVIEHLPVPGHVALSRIRERLVTGGILIVTTPNLYRLRNLAFLAAGRPIFDNFDLPSDRGAGHVLEYSHDHLRWQFEAAGFTDVCIELSEFPHQPNRRTDRLLATMAKPLVRIPRFRNNLLVVARR